MSEFHLKLKFNLYILTPTVCNKEQDQRSFEQMAQTTKQILAKYLKICHKSCLGLVFVGKKLCSKMMVYGMVKEVNRLIKRRQ